MKSKKTILIIISIILLLLIIIILNFNSIFQLTKHNTYNSENQLSEYFEEIKLNYEYVSDLNVKNNNVVIKGYRNEKSYLLINDKEYGGFDYVGDYNIINNSLYYEAREGHFENQCGQCIGGDWIGDKFIMKDNLKFMDINSDIHITNIYKLNNSPLFVFYKQDDENKRISSGRIMYDNRYLENIEVTSNFEYNNSLYSSVYFNDSWYVFKDLKYFSGPYENIDINNFDIFNGKLFVAEKINDERTYYYDDKKLNYERAGVLDGKLGSKYLNAEDKEENRYFIIGNNTYSSKDFNCSSIDLVSIIDNLPIFECQIFNPKNNNYLIIGNKTLGKFAGIGSITKINNSYFYNIVKFGDGQKDRFIMKDNEILIENNGSEFDVDRVFNIDNKLAFVYDNFDRNSKVFIQIGNKTSPTYENIKHDSSNFNEINGKILILTNRGNDWFLLKEI